MRDRQLAVIGYRGAEKSIMNDLLIASKRYTVEFKAGIYWCLLNGETISEPARELAGAAQSNFRIVRIRGFDRLMNIFLNRHEDWQ